MEESFTNFDKGINWRSYVVCDVAYNNVNNWLWTPFVERGPANRMYIEIKFTTRDCSLFPGNALSCKETFSLLYYEFDAATKEPPPWEPDSYKLIGESDDVTMRTVMISAQVLKGRITMRVFREKKRNSDSRELFTFAFGKYHRRAKPKKIVRLIYV